jgi:probable rRNA maturation factor
VEIIDKVGVKIDKSRWEQIWKSLTPRPGEVILVDDREIALYNLQYRGKEGPTDVLSFPLEGGFPFQPLGSVVISVETARRNAEKLGHTLQEELQLLLIHGLLHLLGYDHEKDNGEMRSEERKLIEKFNLPPSLIVRSE